MKCPHCSMEWTDKAGITDAMKHCPFCGGSLAPKKDPENLAECLQQLHSQFGVEPFRLGQRLISLHSDLMPQHTRDRRMLTILVNCGGHTALLDALKKTAGEQSIAISRLEKKMEEEWMIKPDIIREVCSAFWLAIGGSKAVLSSSPAAAPAKTSQKAAPAEQSAHPNKTVGDLIQTLHTVSGNKTAAAGTAKPAAQKKPAPCADYEVVGSALTKYTGSGGVVVVPDHITAIGEYAFKGSYVTEVILPEGLLIISKNAFDGCSMLQKVHFPGSLLTIEDCAFSNCYKLEEVDLPDHLSVIGSHAFSFCFKLRRVRIPGSVGSTGFSCFLSCINLQSAELGEGIKTIDILTFSGCGELRSLKLPDSLESIEIEAFYNCRNISVTASEKWKRSHQKLLKQIP